MFVCLEEIQSANAQVSCPITVDPSPVFQRNDDVTIDSSCHLTHTGLGVFQARLLRCVGYNTGDGYTYFSGFIWVKTSQWDANGVIDQDYYAEFDETLTLTDLNYVYSQAPDTWDGVRWYVIYKIEWKYVPWPESWTDPTNGELIGATGEVELIHNELNRYSESIEDYGTSGGAGIYQINNILGAPDGNSAGLYGYSIGDSAYIETFVGVGFDCDDPATNRYELMVRVNTWSGYTPMVYVYSAVGGTFSLEYSFHLTGTSLQWIDCGELQYDARYVKIVMEVPSWQPNGAALFVDNIKLLPIN